MTITPEAPAIKKCSRCETLKPVTEFRPHQTSADRLTYSCRTCLNALNRLSKARRNGKRCASCGVRKKLRDFPPNPLREDGRGSWCNGCFEDEVNRARRATERRRTNQPAPVLERAHDPVEIGVSWQKQAACGPDSADLFFSDRASETEDAQELCKSCPVAAACAADAAASGTRAGVWGGADRERLTRAQRARASA